MRKIIAAIAVTAAVALGGCIKVSTTPPTDLPPYVRIMPGGQQVMTMDMGALKAEVFQTSSSIPDVISYYTTNAQSDGIPLQPSQSHTNSDGSQQAEFMDNATGRILVVNAKPQGSATLVTLGYRPVSAAAPAALANGAS
jgi:hypothetical protein